MSVSYSEAGAYVPTFSRFRIPLRRRLPHEPSSRPPCRPSPGAVEAGGHGGARNKRKGKPQVEKRAAKRGERSESYSCDTILDMLHIFICMECTFFAHSHALLFRSRVFSRALGCGARRGPACTLRSKIGPRPGSVASALGVQSRGELALFVGSLSAKPDLSKTMETHTKYVNHGRFSHVLLCITARTSRAATLQQPPRFKLFPLWQQRLMLLRVCACVSVGAIGPTRVYYRMLGTRNTNISRTAMQFQLYIFICFALLSAAGVSASHRPPSPSFCSSHGTTAAALQGLPLVTATDGACLYLYYMFVRMCAILRNPHFPEGRQSTSTTGLRQFLASTSPFERTQFPGYLGC